MKTTIRDVAREAGVSISTVSKVFNEYDDVNPDTKDRILKIAHQLDYSPNMAARMLSSKKQRTMALILNELNLTRKSTMPLEMLKGVYSFVENSEYEFVFYATTTEKQKEKTFHQFCNEHSITGAIVQGLKTTDPYYKEIEETKIPTVLVDIVMDNSEIGTISIDNIAASKEAVNYLIEKGHKNIGLINGSRDANVSVLREKGYSLALKENRIPLNESFIQYANFDEDISFWITKDLLSNHKEITALFCSSDIMAIGAMRAVQTLNLNIPQDVAIIGFDDITLAAYVTPSLSTIKQEMEHTGYEAAKLLANIIDGNKTKTSYHYKVPYQLIIRDST